MPAGMLLKSEGFASNLYHPSGRFTLREFCRQNGLPYADIRLPVPLETMTAYGLEFQERFVPEVEDKAVVAVNRDAGTFLVRLENRETLRASKVVVAVGNLYFCHLPRELAHLPRGVLSHSSDHHDLTQFKGRDVTVIGGGASAIDLAALLHEIGAEVRVVVRRPSVAFVFFAPPGPRSLSVRVRKPLSGIGGGWRSVFFCGAPMLFRYLPADYRVRIMRTFLGPAPGWMMKDRIIGRVPLLLAHAPVGGDVFNGRVHLQLVGPTGAPLQLATDHVIAATGYQVDFRRLTFLSDEIRSCLRAVKPAPVEYAPMLSQDFQSSVPGLYFAGLASTYCFGPVMRFMCGAGYTAGRISRHIGRRLGKEKSFVY
jgi:hypothetical protein